MTKTPKRLRRGPVERKLAAYKFPVEMLDKLKTKADKDQTSVTALLERGADVVLAEPEAAPQPAHVVTIADRREQARRQEDRRQDDRRVESCGRCGHAKDAHWSRGCLAGCVCSERMFRKAAS